MRDFKEELRKDREEAKEERKKMNKQWGELANKWGTIVEDIVAPSVKEIAEKYFGCTETEDFMIRRFKQNTKDKSKSREFDVIAVCPEKVLVIEVKSTPKIDYINNFIATIQEVFDYFPEYAEKKLIPIFSSLNIPDNIVKYLTQNKLYAMATGDELMEIVNFDS